MENIGTLYDYVVPSKNELMYKREFKSTELASDRLFSEKTILQNRNKTTFDEEYLNYAKRTVDTIRKPSGQKKLFHKVSHEKLLEDFGIIRDSRNRVKFSLAQFPKKGSKENEKIQAKSNLFDSENFLLKPQNVTSRNDEQKIDWRKMVMSENKDYKHYERKLEPLSNINENNIEMPEKSCIRIENFCEENVKTKRALSDWQRIEFEACLAWAKKHRKIGSFYLEQLGKCKEKDFLLLQAEKRKSALLSLKKKYCTEEKVNKSKPFFSQPMK